MSDATITLRIKGDGSGAVQSVEQVKGSLDGIKAKAKEAGDSMESGLGRANKIALQVDSALAKISVTALALGTAAATGFAAMARAQINVADQTAKMSQRLGIAVEDLSALSFAAELGGSNLQELGVGLQLLARRANDAAEGSKTALASFEAAGIRATDAAGKVRPLNDLLGDLADRFQAMPDGTQKTAMAMDLLGRSGAALIPTLNGGREAIARNREELEGLGALITTDFARASEQFNDNLTRIQRSIGGVVMDITSDMMPAIVELSDRMVSWLRQIREDGTLALWGERLRTVFALLDEIVVFLLGRWVAGMTAATAATLGFGTALNGLPLVAITTAVGLLAVGIYNLVSSNRELEPVLIASRQALDEVNSANTDGVRISEDARKQLIAEAQDRLSVAQAAAAEARAIYEANQQKAAGNLGIGAGLGASVRGDESVRQLEADLAALTIALKENNSAKKAAAEASNDMMGADASLADMMGQWRERVSAAEDAIRKHREGTAEYRQELANLILTKAADAGQSAEQIAALRAQLEQGAAILAQADSLRTARSGAAAAAREQAQAEREAAAAQREVEQATNAAQSAYMGYLQVLDPLAAMELQHAEALAQIDQWHAQGAISAQRYGELKAMAAQTSAQAVQALNRERDVLGQLNREHAEQVRMLGMSRRELVGYQAAARAVAQAQDAWGAQLANMPGYLEAVADLARENAEALYDMEESAGELEDILSRYGDIGMGGLVDQINLVKDAMAEAYEQEIIDPEHIARLQRSLGELRQQGLETMVGASQAVLRSMQSMSERGSSAYRNMEVASQALNVALAIGAILNQGKGDPYTAFARMAAMAVAVAGLVGSIGANFGGGFTDTAAERQATQGTGTVLGDADAKSESIANAIQITADATRELVGINRGMLNALIALQSGIGSATGMLARGAGNVEFDRMVIQPLRHAFLGSVFTPMLRFLSGSSQITDRGIMIGGGGVGSLNPMAYQEEQYRTWRFGSRRTREQTAALPGNVAAQFDLIMDSIVSTVREAATALGLVPEEIEAAIAAYEVAVTRISLDGLSAEEQQAELEAVFSSIFDGLAGSVVPFIEQFQRVGEGLGETLVRVATGVQVMQEAVRRLGFSLDETDPERFAQASEALIELSGGLEGFISGMSSFMDKFATDAHRFAVAQDELNRAFEQAGLAVPATREAMWELMQSLDATTESGREQIATLLRLADVADEYYRLLERRGSLDQIMMGVLRGDWSGPMQQLMQLDAQYRQTLEDAAALGASERELGMIREFHARKLRQIAAQLMEDAVEIARRLGYLSAIGAGPGSAETELGAIGAVAAAVEDRYARELQLLQQLGQFIRGLSTGPLSPLSPRNRMNAAQQEYQRLLALAQGGDLDALGQLQGAAQTYLQQAQGFYGGVGEYEGIFNAVQSSLQALVNAGPQSQQIGPQTPVFGGPVTVEPGEGWAAQNAIERALLAQQLVDHLAALSIALNTPVLELMETLGIPIAQLAADLGVEISNLTGQAVETLAQLAYDLGLPLGELVQALGLNLPDLADGLRELTDQLGIDLSDLSAETAGQLALLAGNLRTDLTTLTTALGIDLGRLVDANSPIFLALEQTIDSLSPAIRDQLAPLLAAVRNATSEADARAAVDAARDAINAMPVGIRAQLAPFFEDMAFPGDLSELEFLSDIDSTLADLAYYINGPAGTNSILRDIFDRLGQGGNAVGFAVGTGFVPADMQAMIHQGEAVLPAAVNAYAQREGLVIGANPGRAMSALTAEVVALRRQVAALTEQVAAADGRKIGLAEQNAQAQAQAARAAERQADIMEQRRAG